MRPPLLVSLPKATRSQWSNVVMDIYNLATDKYIPLEGVVNLEITFAPPSLIDFQIDWTMGENKVLPGQEILREHLRSGSLLRIRDRGDQEYIGLNIIASYGINTRHGRIIASF